MHRLLCPSTNGYFEVHSLKRLVTSTEGELNEERDESTNERTNENGSADEECSDLRTSMLIVRCNNTGRRTAVELCLSQFRNVGHFLAHLAKATGNRPTAIEEAVITLPCDLNRFIPTNGAYLKITKGDQNAFLAFLMVTESTDLPIFYCSAFFKPVFDRMV
jgi:hypothetical protein